MNWKRIDKCFRWKIEFQQTWHIRWHQYLIIIGWILIDSYQFTWKFGIRDSAFRHKQKSEFVMLTNRTKWNCVGVTFGKQQVTFKLPILHVIPETFEVIPRHESVSGGVNRFDHHQNVNLKPIIMPLTLCRQSVFGMFTERMIISNWFLLIYIFDLEPIRMNTSVRHHFILNSMPAIVVRKK